MLPVPALVTQLIAEQADAADRAGDRLRDLAQAIPFLVASVTRPGPGQMDELGNLDGELSAGGNALQLLTDLIENSKGDLLWWRPDAWLLPRESAISVVVGRAVASGRRSRAIYPLRALHEAPEVLLARARQGEQVRVIDEMPTRMLVIRGTHAILPEPLGFADEPRLLVRQPAIVGALTLLFERYWEQATALPDLDTRRPRVDAPRQPAPPARSRGQGRADRAHPRAEPAHRTPAGRRPDDRARCGHAVPGRRRGRAPRLAVRPLRARSRSALGGAGRERLRSAQMSRQHHPVRRGLDVPGTLPLRPVDLAVGAAPERLAGHRDGLCPR